MRERGEREKEREQEIIFGGQLLGGRIKCLWNEVPSSIKGFLHWQWTVGLTQTNKFFGIRMDSYTSTSKQGAFGRNVGFWD
jgi:hypothetical protein